MIVDVPVLPGMPAFHSWTLSPPLRDKEPGAIHEADLSEYGWESGVVAPVVNGTARLVSGAEPGETVALLDACRADEEQDRFAHFLSAVGYKGIRWGWEEDSGVWRVAPLYDWTSGDIWKIISDNNWEYNRMYDRMWKLGLHKYNIEELDWDDLDHLRPVMRGYDNLPEDATELDYSFMLRVGNLYHNDADYLNWNLQKLDPVLFDKMVQQVPGFNLFNSSVLFDYFGEPYGSELMDWSVGGSNGQTV